ncbi:hypothetical protein HaLaN_08875 [Haematococcus lacustris]|uniref:Secreted protein n=1 Tax=Haematococcus lacustris TaxID=44745 RepID=A0A699Z224_HAELA|nr:hypothetical protein HaLaN_08875 [Haematococcus lacustris]
MAAMAAMAAIVTFARNSLTLSSVLAISLAASLSLKLRKEPHGKAPCTTAPLALEKPERAQLHKRELLHARFLVGAKMFAAEVH